MLNRYGPLIVQDPVTMRGVPSAVAIATDPDTSAPLTTLDMNGNAAAVTTNPVGYVGQFQVDGVAGAPIMLEFRGQKLYVVPAGNAVVVQYPTGGGGSGGGIAYDTDGVPYIAATGGSSGLGYDTDGIPYITV